jgi:hypothetical protein
VACLRYCVTAACHSSSLASVHGCTRGCSPDPFIFHISECFCGSYSDSYHRVFYFMSVIKSTNKLYLTETCRTQTVNIQGSSPWKCNRLGLIAKLVFGDLWDSPAEKSTDLQQNSRHPMTNGNMPREFEHMLAVFEWYGSVDSLYRANAVMGNPICPFSNLQKVCFTNIFTLSYWNFTKIIR